MGILEVVGIPEVVGNLEVVGIPEVAADIHENFPAGILGVAELVAAGIREVAADIPEVAVDMGCPVDQVVGQDVAVYLAGVDQMILEVYTYHRLGHTYSREPSFTNLLLCDIVIVVLIFLQILSVNFWNTGVHDRFHPVSSISVSGIRRYG